MSNPSPMPHQWSALESIMDNESLLIEYGTGTGKTRIMVEATMALVRAGEIPILNLVPNSLLEQTEDEYRQWAGDEWTDKHVVVLGGDQTIYQRREALKRGRSLVYVLSHEALSYPLIREGMVRREWAAVFLDEASRFRNYSKRTVTLQVIGRRAASRYAMTGNLFVRNPADGWYVMNWLEPGLFGMTDSKGFKWEYCVMGGYSGTTPIAVRPDRVDRLNEILDRKRIKCELKDIRDLPERTLSVRKVDLTGEQKRAYEQMRDTLRLEIERGSDADFSSQASTYAVRLLRLQEIAAGFGRNTDGEVAYLESPKTRELLALLEDTPDVPTVVWYWWRPELDILATALSKAKIPFAILGRPGAVETFMDGTVNVLLAQLSKGGFGFNLTRAVRMVYHSLPWDLDIYTQSQERNMRLTTTADHLEIIHLVVRKSADEYVRHRLLEKADISAQLSRSQALALLRGE